MWAVMKFDSPLFDGIRVKPDRDRRARTAAAPTCEWPGCQEAATNRAPKGRGLEKDYWNYCLAHAREYNQSYNYFAGMSPDDVLKYQKDAMIGHRPTWKMGQGGTGQASERSGAARFRKEQRQFDDPFDLLRGGGARQQRAAPERPVVGNAQRKALDTMGLEPGVTAPEVKAKFKDLVKRHHPDTNGGDRSTEDRLIEIIQAYNYLKSIGMG